MEKKFDVVALGELLIDFTFSGKSAQGNDLFEANPGGAPCNVLAMLSKLNHKTSFIGKVGDDAFGKNLKAKLDELKIGTENLVLSKTENTTLAFVHTADDGDRSFSFYRKNCADSSLEKKEIRSDIVSSCRIFHYGTLSMTNETVNEATEFAIDAAKKSGALLSFDPNLRLKLWDSENSAREKIWSGISKCDILKIAEEELEFITGENSIDGGMKILRKKFAVPLVCVTRGKNGSEAFFDDGKNSFRAEAKTFSVKTIDTTGAGDTFCACTLHEILRNGFENFSSERLQQMLLFSNAAAAIVTTKKGALSVMPQENEIRGLLAERN